ncbi:hypothetical protein Leryth_025722 [Lithospermum erythrorhizon]|nr:hypothetical protein Leryth_025722 [Lithospermum erythrorhizon]
MGLQLTFLLLEFLLAFAVHGSAGLVFPASSMRSFYEWKRYVRLTEAPHYQESHHLSPANHPRTKVRHSFHSPFKRVDAAPPISYEHPVKKRFPGSAFSPSALVHKNKLRDIMTGKHHHTFPPPSWLGPVVSPLLSPASSPKSWGALTPAPQYPSGEFRMPENSPAVSPLSSSFKTMSPSQSPVLVFPPPPPYHDCTLLSCTEPLTYSPPGSACGCVLPFVVKLRLSISLYTFFPFVTELAKEISAATSLNQSQVRIMGANVANQQLKETIVIIDLLPQEGKFDSNLALSIYKKFWKREVLIMSSAFGSYEVVSINYPGLPPSPPSSVGSGANINDPYYPGNRNDGTAIKPLGVDVSKRKDSERDRRMIVIVVVSSVTAFIACVALLWFLLIKCGCCNFVPPQTTHIPLSSQRKLSGT